MRISLLPRKICALLRFLCHLAALATSLSQCARSRAVPTTLRLMTRVGLESRTLSAHHE